MRVLANKRWWAACAIVASASLLIGCGGDDDSGGSSGGTDAGAGTGGSGSGGTGSGGTGSGGTGGGGTGSGGTGTGGGTTGLNANYTAYPVNPTGTAFDRTLAVNVINGAATVTGLGSYTLAYPAAGSTGGCSVSGGSGADALTQCAETAAGGLLALCRAGQTTETDAVLVRDTAQTLDLNALIGAVPTAGMTFRALQCNGSLNAFDRITVRADGGLDFVIDPPGQTPETGSLTNAEVAAAFSASGLPIDGDTIGLKSYTASVGGATVRYLLAFGAPGTGSPDSDLAPVVFVQGP